MTEELLLVELLPFFTDRLPLGADLLRFSDPRPFGTDFEFLTDDRLFSLVDERLVLLLEVEERDLGLELLTDDRLFPLVDERDLGLEPLLTDDRLLPLLLPLPLVEERDLGAGLDPDFLPLVEFELALLVVELLFLSPPLLAPVGVVAAGFGFSGAGMLCNSTVFANTTEFLFIPMEIRAPMWPNMDGLIPPARMFRIIADFRGGAPPVPWPPAAPQIVVKFGFSSFCCCSTNASKKAFKAWSSSTRPFSSFESFKHLHANFRFWDAV